MPRISRPIQSARARQRGASLVIFTFLSAFVLVPMAGLAIDMTLVFWAKAKLSAAVDAASLAAGRSLNVYDTTAQNSGIAATVAVQWFWANFPNGWLGTSVVGGAPTISYVTTSSSTQQVTVSASATVPLYFARIIRFNQMTISAQAQSSRKNAFVVLVLDRSGSMNLNAAGNACPTMQADAINFTNMFTENFDFMSLVTFSMTANGSLGSSASIDYGPQTVFKSGMTTAINSLQCTGGTSMAQALNAAYQTILNNGLKSGLNAVVLFTDGQPNTIVGRFAVMNSTQLGGTGNTDSRYGSYPANFPSSSSAYNNYSTLYSVGASGCPSSLKTITAALYSSPTPNFGGTPAPAQLGMGWGFFDPFSSVALNSSANLLSGSSYNGCNFTNNSYWYPYAQARLDITALGTTDTNGNNYVAKDYFGNSLVTGYNGDSGYFGANGASAPQTFGTSSVFSGQVRPDMEQGSLTPAAINAADYQAAVMRNDSTYNIVIYTIGLGGAPDYAIDYTLLERMANDPRSPIYDHKKTPGFFAYASDPSQLSEAFSQVASQILQLTQ